MEAERVGSVATRIILGSGKRGGEKLERSTSNDYAFQAFLFLPILLNHALLSPVLRFDLGRLQALGHGLGRGPRVNLIDPRKIG